MPQMAPLSWINLFIMFIIIFLMMNTLNYFSFQYQNTSVKTLMEMKKMNWKW